MRFLVKKGSSKIYVEARELNILSRTIGLMFRTRRTSNLIFNFDKDVRFSIHSLFVFFPFLIVWLDKENRAIGWQIVKPFRLYVRQNSRYRRFMEIPFNSKNRELITFFVGKGRKI